MTAPDGALMQCPLEVPFDHASYAGHFANYPLLPGAVLLDETLQAIHRARGIDLAGWRIAAVKFFDAVRPGDALLLEHEARSTGSIRFTIRAGGRVVADGRLST